MYNNVEYVVMPMWFLVHIMYAYMPTICAYSQFNEKISEGAFFSKKHSVLKHHHQKGFCLVFCPKTFLKFFASEQWESKGSPLLTRFSK